MKLPGLEERARGAALVIALFMLIAVMVVGVSAAQTALNAEKASRNERDRHMALQAAEAALGDAERDIEGGSDPDSARAALFASGSAIGFVEGCGSGQGNPGLGLCMKVAAPLAPAWQKVDLGEEGAPESVTVPYGKFTGAMMKTGSGPMPVRPPRYIIELMPFAAAGDDAGERAGNFYRITAIGFGVRASTRVVLQTFYRKVDPSQAGAG